MDAAGAGNIVLVPDKLAKVDDLGKPIQATGIGVVVVSVVLVRRLGCG